MRAAALPLACALFFTACGSFDEADDPNAPSGVTPTAAGAAQGCPDPLPPNTKCWDFDEGDAPGGKEQNGSFALDPSTSVSPGKSLRLDTAPIPGDERAWAYLVQPLPKAPKVVTLDVRMLVPKEPHAEIGEIRLEGPDRSYSAVLVADEGSLEFRESTFIGLNADKWKPNPLGSVTGRWMHFVVRLEIPQSPAEMRHVVVTVDDVKLIDNATEDLDFAVLEPTQTTVGAGITDVSSYAGQSGVARRLNLDDVIISWTP